jgi:hypothetical protein
MTEKKPLEIHSPIALMPFGKNKGEIIWSLGLSSLSFMLSRWNLSERTRQTFKDASAMFIRNGEYAVLRKFNREPNFIKLMGIYNTRTYAEKQTKYSSGNYDDIVYHIEVPKS